VPRRKEIPAEETPIRHRPATTPDSRETQMIELADKLAEKQLREGTASAQVITHYLKLGSSRERLDQEKLGLEMELLRAKTDQIASQQRTEELFAEAIKAMRSYQGGSAPTPLEADYDYDGYSEEEF
jgi:hypothetical protein